jgi:hypothetical protein
MEIDLSKQENQWIVKWLQKQITSKHYKGANLLVLSSEQGYIDVVFGFKNKQLLVKAFIGETRCSQSSKAILELLEYINS